jgi:hypothetical protein
LNFFFSSQSSQNFECAHECRHGSVHGETLRFTITRMTDFDVKLLSGSPSGCKSQWVYLLARRRQLREHHEPLNATFELPSTLQTRPGRGRWDLGLPFLSSSSDKARDLRRASGSHRSPYQRPESHLVGWNGWRPLIVGGGRPKMRLQYQTFDTTFYRNHRRSLGTKLVNLSLWFLS